MLYRRLFLLDQANLNADDEEEDNSQNDECTIKEEMISVKGKFDLLTGADEKKNWLRTEGCIQSQISTDIKE